MFGASPALASPAAPTTATAPSAPVVAATQPPGGPVQPLQPAACDPNAGSAGANFGQSWRRFENGRLSARECALRKVELATFGDVTAGARLLGGYYNRRSARQQIMMDAGSGFTFVTAIVAGFSARVGQATQRAWLGAAFVPVVLSQHNAHEPTRDLFYAGELALDMVVLRYQKLNELTDLLDTAAEGLRKADSRQCDQADLALATVSAWAAGDDKQAILPEAQRISAACHMLTSDDDQVTDFVNSAKAFSRFWPGRYSGDVLRLDRTLLDRDRDFRYTPVETISSLLASPLRTVDFLLTGNDTQTAINQMKVQTAFSGMDMQLTEIRLPPLPAALTRTIDLSAAAVGRGAVANRTGAVTDKIVRDEITRLQAATTALQGGERRHGFRLAAARELAEAAAADRLTFTYDTTNRVVRVTLAPPASPPTPLVTTAAQPPA